MSAHLFGLTDTGRVRSNNEDAFLARPVAGGPLMLAAVIDGVGGYEGGEVAAAITQETVGEFFEARPAHPGLRLAEALEAANDRILRERNSARPDMACVATLAVADAEENVFHYAHVGDTRLYLLRDGTLVKVSHDHSFVGYLEDSGRLGEGEAMSHPKRNEINKGLGFSAPLPPDYIERGSSPFLPGDLLLLCSDGLTDLVTAAEITQVLQQNTSLQKGAATLVALANDRGGKDNITVVLLRHPARPKKPAPARKKPVLTRTPAPPEPKPAPPRAAEVTRAVAPPQRTRRWPVVLLLILIAAAAAFLFWLWWDKEVPAPVNDENGAPDISREYGVDSLQGANGRYLIGGAGGPQVVAGPLVIERDSVVLRGSGSAHLIADSNYTGPAIRLAASVRYLVLDSMTLEGFDPAIQSEGAQVVLRNVRFLGEGAALQQRETAPPGYFINGRTGRAELRADSLPQKGRNID